MIHEDLDALDVYYYYYVIRITIRVYSYRSPLWYFSSGLLKYIIYGSDRNYSGRNH